MKAVLVIDIPDYVDFNICKTVDVGLCFNVKEYTEPFIKSNVPIKPLPQEKEDLYFPYNEYERAFNEGWNACLEALEDSRNGEDSNE